MVPHTSRLRQIYASIVEYSCVAKKSNRLINEVGIEASFVELSPQRALMRILHVTPYYLPDHWGGIEVHVFELCKYSENHTATVVTSKPTLTTTDAEDQAMRRRVRVHRFRAFEFPKIDGFLPRLYNPYVPLLESKVLEIGDFDIIHVHGQEYFMSHSAVDFAKKHSIPCVLTIHNTGKAFSGFWSVRAARSLMQRTYFRDTIEGSSIAIAVAKGAMDYLSSFHVKASVLIQNGIDLDRFSKLKKSADYVLFVGRLEPLKAPEIFVQAVPLIINERRTRFLVVGAGSMQHYLRKLASDLGISNFISFQENVSYDDLARIVSRASVLVAPANAGYSILEAGAASKPVVSVTSDWNQEALGKAALYVEPDDVHAIADAVLKVLKDDNLSKHLGQEAYSFVKQNRDWRVIYRKIDRIYRQLTT